MATAEEEKEERFFHIPEDIVLDILRRLPVKSILVFWCVSKQWYLFVSRAVYKSQKVVIGPVSYNSSYSRFKSIDQACQFEDIDVFVKHNGVISHLNQARITGGSCNGLLLIRAGLDLFLWNPSTCTTKERLHLSVSSNYMNGIGLCFDSNNNDYKAVYSYPPWDSDDKTMLMVGSFKTKSWRKVPCKFWLHSVGPSLNNNQHFLENNYFDDSPVSLIYFDPAVDEFRNIPLPEAERAGGISLGVLDRCLCITRNDKQDTGAEVLVMKEYCVKESWTFLFKINHQRVGKYFLRSAVPLFFTDETKHEVLMRVTRSDWQDVVVTYDTNNNFWKEVAVIPINEKPSVYEETSVQPSLRKISTTLDSHNKSQKDIHQKLIWRLHKTEEEEE